MDTSDSHWGSKKPSAKEVAALQSFWDNQVLSGYVAQIKVPLGIRKPEKWKLSMRDPEESRRVLLQYPDRLAPCSLGAPAAK